MLSKVVLAAALLCLTQGFHISQTYQSIIQQYGPKVVELKEVIEELSVEAENVIALTAKYVDAKIQHGNDVVQSKILNLEQQTTQFDRKLNVCFNNAKSALKEIDLDSIQSTTEHVNWASYEKRLTELKALKVEAGLAIAKCIAAGKLNPDVTSSCTEETLASIEKQAKALTQHIATSMSMVKNNVSKSVQLQITEIFNVISDITSEMSSCTEGTEEPTEEETYLSVVEKLKPKVDELKEVVEQLTTEASTSLTTTSKYVDLKVEDGIKSVQLKLTAFEEQTQQLNKKVNVCVSNVKLLEQDIDLESLYTVKDHFNWVAYEKQLSKLQALIRQVAFIPAACIAESKLDAVLTRSCIEEKIEAIGTEAKQINTYITSSMSMVKSIVAKSVQEKVLEMFEVISKISSEIIACEQEQEDETYLSVVEELKPKVDELKEVVEQLTTEASKSLTTTSKYVDLKVEDGNKSVQLKLTALEEQTQQLNKKVNVCVSNVKLSEQDINLESLYTVKDHFNWAAYEKQLSKLQALIRQVAFIPAACIAESKLDAVLTRSCIEENIEAIGTEAKQINTHITSSMSMVKSIVAKSVQEKVLEMFEVISKISSEIKACEEEQKEETYVSVVEELQPKVDELKEVIKQITTETAKALSSTVSYVDLKLEDAAKVVESKLNSFDYQTLQLDKKIDVCLNNFKKAVQSINVDSIYTINDHINWAGFEKQLSTLKSLNRETALIPGTCVGESKLNAAFTRSCIEEKLESIEKQAKAINEYITSAMHMVKDSVVKSVQLKVVELYDIISKIDSEFTACSESKSYTMEEVIAEYNSKAEILKRKIAQATSYSKNQLDRISTIIQETRDEASDVIDTQLIKVSESVKYALTSDKNIESCLNQQETSIAKLGDSGINQCGQNQLESFEEHINKLAYYINVLSNGPTTCLKKQQSGSGSELFSIQIISAKDLKICLDETLEQTESSGAAMTEEVKSMVQATETAANNCINHAKSSAVQSIQGIISTFNFCVESSSYTIEEVIAGFNSDAEILKRKIAQATSYSKNQLDRISTIIQDTRDKAADVIDTQLIKLSESVKYVVTSNKNIASCLNQQETSIAKLGDSGINQCAQNELQSLEEHINKLAYYINVLSNEPTTCLRKQQVNSAKDLKICLDEILEQTESSAAAMTEEVRSMVQDIETSANNCINHAKSSAVQSIQGIISTFNFCVEESSSEHEHFKEMLEEVNAVARDASSEWSGKLESLKANIDKEVQIATSYINVNVKKVLEEKAAQCPNKINSIILDFDTLQSCTTPKHLETLSEKLDIFVRIESTVSAAFGYCSRYEDVEACIEKAVANGQSQVDKLNSEISTLYILGSKAGTDCVHNAKQNMLNHLKNLSLTC